MTPEEWIGWSAVHAFVFFGAAVLFGRVRARVAGVRLPRRAQRYPWKPALVAAAASLAFQAGVSGWFASEGPSRLVDRGAQPTASPPLLRVPRPEALAQPVAIRHDVVVVNHRDVVVMQLHEPRATGVGVTSGGSPKQVTQRANAFPRPSKASSVRETVGSTPQGADAQRSAATTQVGQTSGVDPGQPIERGSLVPEPQGSARWPSWMQWLRERGVVPPTSFGWGRLAESGPATRSADVPRTRTQDQQAAFQVRVANLLRRFGRRFELAARQRATMADCRRARSVGLDVAAAFEARDLLQGIDLAPPDHQLRLERSLRRLQPHVGDEGPENASARAPGSQWLRVPGSEHGGPPGIARDHDAEAESPLIPI